MGSRPTKRLAAFLLAILSVAKKKQIIAAISEFDRALSGLGLVKM